MNVTSGYNQQGWAVFMIDAFKILISNTKQYFVI